MFCISENPGHTHTHTEREREREREREAPRHCLSARQILRIAFTYENNLLPRKFFAVNVKFGTGP